MMIYLRKRRTNIMNAFLQSGEKMALVTNVIISQSFYFTLIMEIIPATSKTVPLLGR